jgi:tetratricopeptide (TPR) repeat protein
MADSIAPNVRCSRHFAVGALIAGAIGLALPPVHAAESDALHFLRTGKYAEAEESFSRDADQSVAAAIGLARTYAAQGKLDKARTALAPWAGKDVAVDAEVARMAFENGHHEEAERLVRTVLDRAPDHVVALWIQAELHRSAGRRNEAAAICERLVKTYNDSKINDVETLRWIGLAAARHAAWNSASDQFRFLTTAFYPDVLALEPDFWRAHYDAGCLLLEKYNQADATKQFRAALEINPQAADAHVAMAELALLQRKVEEAEASIARALEINPHHVDALRTKADIAWLNSQFDIALDLLEGQVLPRNPLSEDTFGRLLAAKIVREGDGWRDKDSEARTILDQVLQRNPLADDFYLAAVEWLQVHHRKQQAAELLTRALDASPEEPRLAAALGQIKMQMGREEEARDLFREAFDRDPFNVRTSNMLEMLGVLDDLEAEEVGGCILRYEDRRDGLLASYAGEFLANDYPRLCELFDYTPAEPPLVEILNESRGVSGAQWFGTRMTGLPYVGSVAACTGDIVVMVSPNDQTIGRKFNWAETLRHEMVHVVTLQQTGYRIPHWYTEGLAVWCEGKPRPLPWNPLLVRREAADTLLDLSNIDFGFTRPESCEDRALAYCQAELYVEYMLKGRSEQVLRDLLNAYAEGLTTSDAIERVFGMSQGEFEREYRKYVGEVAVSMSDLLPEADQSFADLLTASRDDSDNADLAAELAHAYLQRGALREALASARQALELTPRHARATYVVARLQVRAGRPEMAVALLEDCLDKESPDLKVVNLLAGLHLKARDYETAERLYQLGMRKNPNNPTWLRLLQRVYEWQGDKAKTAQVMGLRADMDPADVDTRKKLVQAALESGDYESAVKWANQAVQVDVNDAELHKAFAEALIGRHNRKMALRELEAAVRLDPEDTDTRLALAETLLALGRNEEAREVATSLKGAALDRPRAAALQELQEAIDRP